jgi:biopolymer transport protein ExbD
MEFEGRARIRPGFDIAPLVDVVFLLHIFFLLTMTYSAPKALALSLPASAGDAASRQPVVSVEIDRNGLVSLAGTPVAPEALRHDLAEQFASGRRAPAEIAADARTSVQALVQVLEALRSAGADDVSVLTRDDHVR